MLTIFLQTVAVLLFTALAVLAEEKSILDITTTTLSLNDINQGWIWGLKALIDGNFKSYFHTTATDG